MIGSYFTCRLPSERRGHEGVTYSSSSILIATVLENSILTTILVAGSTFGSIDKNWIYHGAPYYLMLIAVALGGAVGGVALYFWELFLTSKYPTNDN